VTELAGVWVLSWCQAQLVTTTTTPADNRLSLSLSLLTYEERNIIDMQLCNTAVKYYFTTTPSDGHQLQKSS